MKYTKSASVPERKRKIKQAKIRLKHVKEVQWQGLLNEKADNSQLFKFATTLTRVRQMY